MGTYKFSDIRLDSNIKEYQYLPYLEGMNPELIDEYNKFILKRRFGYYQDENNPNQYFIEENRQINDNDIIKNFNKQLNELNNLINLISYDFAVANANASYYKRPEYEIYKKIVIDNLNEENIRLNKIINNFQSLKLQYNYKKYKVIHLILVIIILFYIMILSFNYYNN